MRSRSSGYAQNTILILFITTLLGVTSTARAEEQVTTAEPAGKTIMARGRVDAKADLQIRPLQRLSPVYPIDVVSTGTDSSSQLRMTDGALLSMQADTTLAINNYQVDPGNASSTVTMELLKGGLRTITGTLPKAGQSYELNTPVASIGVRGTHYEARLEQGDLYLAGWDGIIDINVTVPGANQRFSLGPTEPFRFAIVRADGTVEFLIRAPALFAVGQTLTLAGEPEYAGQFASPPDRADNSKPWSGSGILAADASGRDFYNNEQVTAGWGVQPMDSISRSGTVSFDHLSSHSFISSAGPMTDLSMSMQVDFDSAWVPAGHLSFTDTGGEWFAVFSGVFGSQSLDLSIHAASHGNQLADGSISGLLINNASAVLGNLSLYELENPTIRLDGGFVLTEQP